MPSSPDDTVAPVDGILAASRFALETINDVLNRADHGPPARAGWVAAQAVGRIAELTAALPGSTDQARAILRSVAETIGRVTVVREVRTLGRANAAAAPPTLNHQPPVESPLFASMRARVARCSPSAFLDWSRDAAAAYGDVDAANASHAILCALIEGIKIIDDIQDQEERCIAAEVGTGRALNLALAALAHGLERTADLPFPDPSWRAAAAAIGRGMRETAIGQQLETVAAGTFEDFWSIVDRKTAPLVATALELGALAAGADPPHAAALTRLAIPLGRLLQIGDDMNDALGAEASDWRTPHLNLLMLYSLSGPRGQELASLLRNAKDPETLRAAQICLLRDGALAYAIHAQVTTLETLAGIIRMLALPNPEPFLQSLERQRAQTETLLRNSGVDETLAANAVTLAS